MCTRFQFSGPARRIGLKFGVGYWFGTHWLNVKLLSYVMGGLYLQVRKCSALSLLHDLNIILLVFHLYLWETVGSLGHP